MDRSNGMAELQLGLPGEINGCLNTRRYPFVPLLIVVIYSQEGVHLDIYRRLESLKVTSFQDEKMMDCVSYQMIDPVDMTPSPHYIRVIQAGAKQNNIPTDYLRFLDCIEHNGYSGQVKIYDEVMKDVKL